ncbi:uncharacterized protein [Pyrus communis]|uniref:uncharacterized protein n=1 Tax=Pyrus communis TaxID=23211 RepID=UPI0035C1C117
MEIDKNKARVIMESPSPTNKVQLQRLLEKINFLRRFIANLAGAGIVMIDPKGIHHCYSFLLDYKGITNNRAEYEALIISLEILIKLGADEIEVYCDSELVINQLNGEYKRMHITMAWYYLAVNQLLNYWGNEVTISHVPRESNLIAHEMAQKASGAQVHERGLEMKVEI